MRKKQASNLSAVELKLYLPLLAVSAISFSLAARAYRHQLSPDGISYISIAQQYLGGHFDTAVNGFWSPMISWLLVPVLALGVDAQVAFVSLNVLAALVTLGTGMWLVRRHSGKGTYSVLLFWALATPFLIKTIQLTTPDGLLLAGLMVLLATLIWIDQRLNVYSSRNFKLKAGGLLGLVAAVAYFSKIVALPLYLGVVAAWLLLRAWRYRRENPGGLFSRAAASYLLVIPVISLVAMTILIAPWSYALSQKYGYFTIGSSIEGHATGQLSGTSAGGVEQGLLSLTIPPHEHAYTSAEERTPYAGERSADSREGGADIADVAGFAAGKVVNTPAFLSKVSDTSKLIPLAIFALLLAISLGKVTYSKNRAMIIIGMVVAVYMAGFVLIAGSSGGIERYYWPLVIFAFTIIGLGVQGLWALATRQRRWRQLLFIFLSLFLVAIVVTENRPYAFGEPLKSGSYLLSAEILEAVYIEPGSKLASNNRGMMRGVAYYLNSQTYGSIGNREFSSDEVHDALRHYGIDYFFYFYPTDEQERLDISGLAAEKVGHFEFDYFNCRDVRYGEYGVGVDQEHCTVEVVRLIY